MNLIRASQARKRLREFSSKSQVQIIQRFFKVQSGGYSEHDQFIGVKVPDTRKVAKEFKGLPLQGVKVLLVSKIHEERLLALIILVNRSQRADPKELKDLAGFYLRNLKHVNNWDLVDVSAEHLLGRYFFSQCSYSETRKILSRLARSKDLWERRISILATFHFIRQKEFKPTFEMAHILLQDEHDLIHKAVGWMLREAGNRDLKAEEDFLRHRYRKMPRTMLRYAIERFPEKRRRAYLKGLV